MGSGLAEDLGLNLAGDRNDKAMAHLLSVPKRCHLSCTTAIRVFERQTKAGLKSQDSQSASRSTGETLEASRTGQTLQGCVGYCKISRRQLTKLASPYGLLEFWLLLGKHGLHKGRETRRFPQPPYRSSTLAFTVPLNRDPHNHS